MFKGTLDEVDEGLAVSRLCAGEPTAEHLDGDHAGSGSSAAAAAPVLLAEWGVGGSTKGGCAISKRDDSGLHH